MKYHLSPFQNVFAQLDAIQVATGGEVIFHTPLCIFYR